MRREHASRLEQFAREWNLTRREQGILNWQLSVHGGDFDSHAVFPDISQSVNRTPRGVNVCPSLTPSGKVAIINPGPMRIFTGVEGITCQHSCVHMLRA